VACLVLLTVAAIAISVFSYEVPEKAIPFYRGLTEPLVNVRDIEFDLEQQLREAAAIDVKGDTKKFKFYANNSLMIDEWYERIPLVLGNVKSNECDFIVSVLDEDDTLLYRSMGLVPGKYLPAIKLFNEMPYGTYDLTVVVAAYDPDSFENIGVQHMKLKLVIGIEQSTQ